MSRIGELCVSNMGFVLALTGFDVAILTILLTRSGMWSWTMEAVGGLLAISVFSLTFSFFVYHTVYATEQDRLNPENAARLMRKGNLWTEVGLFSLILTVPIGLWGSSYYFAFAVSIVGLGCVAYRFVKRSI